MRFTSMLVSAFLLVANASAAEFTGTWKLNGSKSNTKVNDRTIRIEQIGPNTYRNTQDDVSPTGEKQHAEIVRIYDGKEHPSQGVGFKAGRSEVCQMPDATTRKIIVKQNGKEILVVTSTLSADGKTMTNVTTGATTETQVYDRQ